MSAPLRHPVAVLKERPFNGRLRRLEVDWNNAPSIAQILDAQDDLPQGFRESCVARVIDEIVPREMWRYVRPKPCCIRDGKVIDVVVVFSLPLGNSGGGGAGLGGGGHAKKNPVVTVAAIAVLLVGAAVSAGALGALAPGLAPLLGAGTFGAHVAGALIGLGGALAIAALSPPPTLRNNQGTVSKDTAASLSGNVLSKGGSVPRVIGTMRIFPPIISPPLIEIVNGSEVAECVFGLAGPHALSAINVGTTTAVSIPDLQTEIQEGLPDSPILGLVTRQSYTDPTAVVDMISHVIDESTGGNGINLLDQDSPPVSCPQWMGMTSRIAPDEIWIHFSLPSGITDTAGSLLFVPFRIQIRPTGTSTWINLPEFHFIRMGQGSCQFAAKLMWQAPPSGQNPVPNQGGPVIAYYTVPTQTVNAPIGSGGWQADSYFYSGSGATYYRYDNYDATAAADFTVTQSGVQNVDCFTDKIQFYLNDPSKFPQSGSWDIQAIRGQAFAIGNFNQTNYENTVDGSVYDWFGYFVSAGIARTWFDQRTVADDVSISQLSSIWNEPPVPNPAAFAVIAAKVTNRSIDQLSVLASSYVKDWDGTGWNTVTTTSNPAPHLYDVLTGTQGGSPLPAEIVDSMGIVAFRAHCATMGYTCNAVAEGKTYIDVGKMIAGTGYAQLTHSELWGVAMDQDTSGNSPVQVFTPRNMSGFAVSKPLALLPTGIRAGFNDASNNYLPNEIIVFDDSANPDSSRLEQIAYDGLVNLADVQNRAAFDLLQGKLRLTFYKGKADIEAIVCQRGDLVAVQNDILDNYAGASRVQAVQRSGGNIIGLTLDGSLPISTGTDIATAPDLSLAADMADYGARTGLCIRLKGGNGTLLNQVTAAENGDDTAITFTTPFSDPGTSEIDVGCLVTAGRLGTEYRRLKVFGVNPATDMTADLSFVDEAAELWSTPVGTTLDFAADSPLQYDSGAGETIGVR